MKSLVKRILSGILTAAMVFTTVSLPVFAADGTYLISKRVTKDENHVEYLREEFEYDNDGNMIKSIIFSRGNQVETCIYEHNDEGLVTKETYHSVENEDFVIIYTYDDHGRIININDGDAIETYEYNAQGLLTKKNRHYEDGGEQVETYAYDSGENLIENLTYENGVRRFSKTYTYDENNKKTEFLSQQFLSSGTLYSRMVYEYDSEGKEIRSTEYQTSQNTDPAAVKVSLYDENGNLVRTTWTYRGGSSLIYVYEYDSLNRKIRWTEENPDEGTTVSEFITYDENGNVIKRVLYDGGVVTSIEEYEYKFFKSKDAADESEGPAYIEGKNLSWYEAGGKSFWYENGVKQGTYDDPKGVVGFGTVRGREIYDPESGAWYWLDSVNSGARAIGKEVWMPYIYQNEKGLTDEEKYAYSRQSDPGMQDLVYAYMQNGTGKWVRYDENGKMLKGWVTIEGALAEKYPDQKGNTYYYDTKTGLMAKGEITIDGETYFFDELTGVRQ